VKGQLGKLVLAIAGISAITFYLWSLYARKVEVETDLVSQGPMQVTVDEDGKTRIHDRYIVSSPLLGTLLRVGLRPGDAVISNETVLATIQPTAPGLLDARQLAQAEAREKAAELAVKQSTSNLASVRELLTLAEKTYGRVSQLRGTDAASQQEMDEAETQFRSQKNSFAVATMAEQIATFELQQAKAALMHANSQATDSGSPDFLIRSPIDGRVLRVFQESSAVVQPGTPLLELGDPTNLEIELDVLSTEAVKVLPGNSAMVERWGGAMALHAVVRRIEPAGFTKISALGVEEQRVNVILDLTEPPAERPTLGDGFRVECRIITWETERVLRVPTSALFRLDKNWAVFVAENGVAKRKSIEIGHRNREYAEVLSGLTANSVVILYPTDQIQDGVRVKVANAK
jgi:HlyD family secretion protein